MDIRHLVFLYFYYCIFVSGLVSCSGCKLFMSGIIIVLLLLIVDLKADDIAFKMSHKVAYINQLTDYLVLSKLS